MKSMRSAFALGIVTAAVLSSAAANADVANWSFYKGAAVLKEHHRAEGNGMVGVFDVEVRRGMTGVNQKDMICDYQAYVTLTLPSGYPYTDQSPFHAGCNQYAVPAWFTFPQYGSRSSHETYPQGSVLEGGWRDNFTGGEFKRVGALTL